MNIVEKDRFVHEVCDSLKKLILEKVDSMPENWDGIEIRKFIADYYAQHFITDSFLKGQRKREYQNTLITKNLI